MAQLACLVNFIFVSLSLSLVPDLVVSELIISGLDFEYKDSDDGILPALRKQFEPDYENNDDDNISELRGLTLGCVEEEVNDRKALGTEDMITAFSEPPVCGKSIGIFNKVVGGTPARLGQYPWMALVGYKCNHTLVYRCGGTIISSKHIMTAAHCIHGLENYLHHVRLGELDLARDDDGATPIDIKIKSFIKHEDFGTVDHSNDIGVLVLQEEVTFTDLIKPICLPLDSGMRMDAFDDSFPFVAGWGSTKFMGEGSSALLEAQMPVINNTICNRAYKRRRIDETVICAGFGINKDACQGDSGGPLMMPITEKKFQVQVVLYCSKPLEEHAIVIYRKYNKFGKYFFYQIGVVSFGKKCAERGYPGVYAKVGFFMPWLEKNILSHT